LKKITPYNKIAMNKEDKTTRLNHLAGEVENLAESPLHTYRQENNYHTVFGEGDVNAKIMFVGEAPGKKEAETGRPFVGAAGRILDELLQSINLARQDVYITNVVKDRPPENRDPTREEIDLYRPFLVKQIDIIQPQVMATLGRFAMEFILHQFDLSQKGQTISNLHGQLLQGRAAYGDITIVPLYHPAAALYNRRLRETLEKDFKALKQFG